VPYKEASRWLALGIEVLFPSKQRSWSGTVPMRLCRSQRPGRDSCCGWVRWGRRDYKKRGQRRDATVKLRRAVITESQGVQRSGRDSANRARERRARGVASGQARCCEEVHEAATGGCCARRVVWMRTPLEDCRRVWE
jgi:hypothetical protein